jgi:hypothetical protein
MANDVGCNPAGGNCRWDHNALVAAGVEPTEPYGPIAGKKITLVGVSPAYQIYEWSGGDGGWSSIYSYTSADAKTIGGGKKEPGDDDKDDGTGGEPPSFPSTGPVFTPLDLTAPSENPSYRYNYPTSWDSTYDTGADFQSKGLLNDTMYNVDPYQPWSSDYGSFMMPDNLWNYQPPSVGDSPFYYDLSKGPGPKVGFAK